MPRFLLHVYVDCIETPCVGRMVTCASKTVALTALRLLEDNAARAAAMDEFVARTGGGVGGSNWIAPLCDYDPPIDFRWPEYVTTPRGRDWWIPSASTA